MFFGLLDSAIGRLRARDAPHARNGADQVGPEARPNTLLDQVPALMWSTDTELRITFRHGSAGGGFDVGDELVAAAHRRALSGESVGFEMPVQGRYFEAHVEPLRDASGGVTGTIGCALDVSDRLHAEAEANRARACYVALVEQIPAATYVYSIGRDRLEFVSPQICELLGFATEDWFADPKLWQRLVHPEDRRYVLATRERCGKQGAPFGLEYRVLRRDGAVLWLHDRAAVVRDETGAPSHIHGVLFDVTDRRGAEEAVRASEGRYRALVEASPDAIVATDLNGVVTVANQQAARLLAISPGEPLVGRHIRAFVAPEDALRVAGWTVQAQVAGPVLGLEYTLLTARGGRVPVELSIALIRDTNDQPIAMLSMIRDLSGRRRTEEALRESEAKSRFLATMSHELRTPLNSVLGFAQLLGSGQFGGLTPRQSRYVENITAGGRHLLDLVNDVLDIAEAHSGHMRVLLEPVLLEPLAADELDKVRIMAEAKQIRLELDRGKTPLVARADRDRLQQVFSNLLTNAVKFTPAGGRVTVLIRRKGPDIEVAVEDTGIGIPLDAQARIFDHFVQVDGGRTRQQEGTGLGLALTRELVQLMGGRIALTSEPGKGSAFTVSLPADAYEPEPAAMETAPGGRRKASIHN